MNSNIRFRSRILIWLELKSVLWNKSIRFPPFDRGLHPSSARAKNRLSARAWRPRAPPSQTPDKLAACKKFEESSPLCAAFFLFKSNIASKQGNSKSYNSQPVWCTARWNRRGRRPVRGQWRYHRTPQPIQETPLSHHQFVKCLAEAFREWFR